MSGTNLFGLSHRRFEHGSGRSV